MPSSIQITYLNHSGFAIRSNDTLLVFDDAQGKLTPGDSLKNGRITKDLIETFQRTLYFVSHAHADHFDPEIYNFYNANAIVYYVLSDDLPAKYKGYRMKPGDTLELGGATINAYASTDEGVSYLVRINGWNIFHAGDLNLWHWREQSTLKEIEQAERDYLQAVEPLLGTDMDFAFFPVDPRMGELYDAGAVHFSMHLKPRIMIPMHWWGRADVALEFARKNRSKRTEIIALTKPGQTITAQKQENGVVEIEME